jgi:crotonobetainyl-CoA:carnitine CoA-transferase CaiB-like acyl-CoA transferase
MSGPLASLKVLDFSTLLPGPFATLMLADMGAEVLRVESPTRPDMVRLMPPSEQGVSAVHGYINRSKRSIAVNLKTPEGRDLIHRLVAGYDIVVEQFRPGVMDRLGVGYEALKAINPRLIYCSITGYGQTGPYRDRAGHDLNYLSIAGMTRYNGRRDSGPAPMAFQAADIAGGSCHAVMGILAAPAALLGGEDPDLETTWLNGGSFYDCYRTRDGRYLSVAGLEPQFFGQFCQAIGKPHLVNLAVSTAREDVRALKAEISAVIASQDYEHWCGTFAELDCCVEPVLSFSEAAEHPQLRARDMVVAVPNHGQGHQRQVASPFKFSATPVGYRFSGARLGQHNRDVLREQGLTDADIDALEQAGAIASEAGA